MPAIKATGHRRSSTSSESGSNASSPVVASSPYPAPTFSAPHAHINSHSGNASVTYAALIALAIELSEERRLVLDDIYKFVEKHRGLVPVKSHPNWKNSVRHNLSLRPCFVKVARFNSSGKAMSAWWTLDTSCLPKAAKEAVERARKFTEGSTNGMMQVADDKFIREVLTVEDQQPTLMLHGCMDNNNNMNNNNNNNSLTCGDNNELSNNVNLNNETDSCLSHDNSSQSDSGFEQVPDASSTEFTPSPPFTVSNSFLFVPETEEEFAMVPSHAASPPHLFFPEPVEENNNFISSEWQIVYPEYDYKPNTSSSSSTTIVTTPTMSSAQQPIFPDITLPSPFSKNTFAFHDLLFTP